MTPREYSTTHVSATRRPRPRVLLTFAVAVAVAVAGALGWLLSS